MNFQVIFTQDLGNEQKIDPLEARQIRISQLLDAMTRYDYARKRIPKEWMEELREINRQLK